ncbi:hypothetical protein BC828DRAFT_259333 [Blastocladiella britannica]|nr:hypothetical protein BC828DRAFT_259333 [Blastocladiella britannica]
MERESLAHVTAVRRERLFASNRTYHKKKTTSKRPSRPDSCVQEEWPFSALPALGIRMCFYQQSPSRPRPAPGHPLYCILAPEPLQEITQVPLNPTHVGDRHRRRVLGGHVRRAVDRRQVHFRQVPRPLVIDGRAVGAHVLLLLLLLPGRRRVHGNRRNRRRIHQHALQRPDLVQDHQCAWVPWVTRLHGQLEGCARAERE